MTQNHFSNRLVPKSFTPSHSLLVDKNLISDPKAVAEKFNDYFSSIASNLQKKLDILEMTFLIF